MSVEFWMTAMGKRHYEHTMPELVGELRRLNDNLERLVRMFCEQRATEAAGSSEEATNVQA